MSALPACQATARRRGRWWWGGGEWGVRERKMRKIKEECAAEPSVRGGETQFRQRKF